MTRCVPKVIEDGTVDTSKTKQEQGRQAAAICSSMWERAHNNMSHCKCEPGQACQCSHDGMARVTLHAHQSGPTRRDHHDGREHLVVPVVAVVEGVLNNQLVLASEFARQPTLNSWNGVPVPVGHPSDPYGNPISANSPEVVDKTVIGRLYRVHAQGDRLKGEIWIDVEKAERLGHGSIVQALEAGDPVEVSTGYFAEVDQTPGQHNGERYIGIHRNIAPDHLALLPDIEGACNWADGCGAPRTHAKQGNDDMRTQMILAALGLQTAADIVANADSLNDRIMAVRDAVDNAAAGDRMRFTVDVFDETVVFEEEGTLMQQQYTRLDDGTVSLEGSPEQVRLDKQYVPVNQSRKHKETTVSGNEQQDGDKGAALTAEDQTMLNHARTIVNERRAECIETIMAHKANPYAREELEAMDYPTLKGLEAFARGKPTEDGAGDGGGNGGSQHQHGADYSGRGGPATPHTHGDAPEPLAIPGAPTAKAANE